MLRTLTLISLLIVPPIGVVMSPSSSRAEETYPCPNNSAETCHKPPCKVGDTASSDSLPDGTSVERECVMPIRKDAGATGARINARKLPTDGKPAEKRTTAGQAAPRQ